MSSALAPVWFNFFLEAGIPPADAGNYAVKFTENRIQADMMADLTKDYLADMGITVLGDVIAILKHARVVHAQAAREKALQCTGLTAPVPESIQPASQSNSILETEQKRKQPVSVTAGASGQKSVSKTVPPNQNVKSGAVKSPLPTNRSSVPTPRSTESSADFHDSAFISTSSARKQATSAKGSMGANGGVGRPQNTVELSKVQAESNQKQAASLMTKSKGQSNKVTDVKPSIFNRLGREVGASSSVDGSKSAPSRVEPKFNVTLPDSNVEPILASSSSSSSLSNSTSIFGRLGNKTAIDSRLPVHLIDYDSSEGSTGKHLIKTSSTRPLPARNTSGHTVSGRLGPPVKISPRPTTEGIFGANATVSTLTTGAKLRLGAKRPSSTLTTGAKLRLGDRQPASTLTTGAQLRLGTKRPASTLTTGAELRLGTKRTASAVTVTLPHESKVAKTGIKARLGLQDSAVGQGKPVAIAKPQLQETSPSFGLKKTSGVFGRLGSFD